MTDAIVRAKNIRRALMSRQRESHHEQVRAQHSKNLQVQRVRAEERAGRWERRHQERLKEREEAILRLKICSQWLSQTTSAARLNHLGQTLVRKRAERAKAKVITPSLSIALIYGRTGRFQGCNQDTAEGPNVPW